MTTFLGARLAILAIICSHLGASLPGIQGGDVSPGNGGSYIVTAPRYVRPGANATITVDIFKWVTPVNVTVTLVEQYTWRSRGEQRVELAKISAIVGQGHSTLQLEVPNVEMRYSCRFLVSASGGLGFSRSLYTYVKRESMSLFIQTDKGIYKAGQKVNYRVFAVNSTLRPYLGSFNVSILDPNRNKIQKFVNATGEQGVFSGSLLLSDQPVFGTWKIIVDIGITQKQVTFKVDKYVLPKFEVSVKLPPFVTTAQSNIPVSIRAKYTYGKGLTGNCSVDATFQYYRIPARRITLPMVDGKAEFLLSMKEVKELALRSHSWLSYVEHGTLNYWNLRFKANVTDSLSGILRTAEGSVTFRSYSLKFISPSFNRRSFVPGSNYSAIFYLRNQDGTIPSSETPLVVTVHKKFIFNARNDIYMPRPPSPIDDIHLPRPPSPRGMPGMPGPSGEEGPRGPNGEVGRNHHVIRQWRSRTMMKLSSENVTVLPNGSIPLTFESEEEAWKVALTLTLVSGGKADRFSTTIPAKSSPSENYLTISSPVQNFTAGQTARLTVTGTEILPSLTYMLYSRGNLRQSGIIDSNGNSSFIFELPLISTYAPLCKLIMYYMRDDGDLVAEAVVFYVDGIYENKVTLSANAESGKPAESLTLTVSAEPGSYLGLVAVDQSVNLMKEGNEITHQKMLSEVNQYSRSGWRFDSHDGIYERNRLKQIGGLRSERIFQNFGVNMFTDALQQVTDSRRQSFAGAPGSAGSRGQARRAGMRRKVNDMAAPSGMAGRSKQSSARSGGNVEPSRTRTNFPETWLWLNETIDNSGQKSLQVTVPDTITSWMISSFALHETSGIGVVEDPFQFTVFKPFFVSLNLPYSVIRGEEVAIQAIVYNYMSQDLVVNVHLEGSSDFEFLALSSNGSEISMVKGNGESQYITVKKESGMSVSFPIVARKIGQMKVKVTARSPLAADALERTLLVFPEGTPDEYSTTVLAGFDERIGTAFSKTVHIEFPPDVVEGSQRVEVKVAGDLMGPALNNLDKLLKMPYGCGEQNMLNFAPNIFISRYLNFTDQLTPEIKEKAVHYMEKGYQRELTYQHRDGSFSAFGDDDDSGSMWLTAFVIRSFQQAKSFIFIDDEIIEKGLKWIIERQDVNGSFPEPGRVIHSDMQGGASAGDGLTAYVLVTLLEIADIPKEYQENVTQAINKATTHLKNRIESLLITSPYVLSLVHYAFAFKGEPVDDIKEKLNLLAVEADNIKYWTMRFPTNDNPDVWRSRYYSRSVDVEMTAYNLIAYTMTSNMSVVFPILKWITQQQNGNGGFVSTQDTVVGLQALSEIAARYYISGGDVQLDVVTNSEQFTFDINPSNRLLLRSYVMRHIPENVTIEGSGQGLVIVQVAVSFYREPPVLRDAFTLNLTVTKDTRKELTLNACTRYIKESNTSTGMAVMRVGILSGYVVEMESITGTHLLKRKEIEDRNLVLYFDYIPSTEEICLEINFLHADMVTKPKPAYVQVFDYYHKEDEIKASYKSVYYNSKSLCSVCDDCKNTCG